MEPYFAKTPKIIQYIFPDFTWKIAKSRNSSKEIYLTFDDGPIPEITDWVLKILDDFDVKATFFCVGDNIKKYPEVLQNILDNDHAIGNHTFNHLNGWRTNTDRYIENVIQSEKIYKSTFENLNVEKRRKKKEKRSDPSTNNKQQTTKLFRPPYGKIRPSQRKALQKKGYQIIMWDVLSGDFDPNLSKEKCLQNVVKSVENGSIIVFHDSIKAFEKLQYALPKTLSFLINNGYEFKTLS